MVPVLLDSNVYVSAVVFGGNPQAILELAEHGVIVCFTSPAIIEEVERTLRLKFDWSEAAIRKVGAETWRAARVIRPNIRVADCSDADDNRILECALASSCRLVVTGDRHLLVLHPYKAISILRPREFLDLAPWRSLPL